MAVEVKMWTEQVPVEQAALEQIERLSQLPVIASHIAIMPDVHMGKGACVGSVIPTRDAVIPAAVGVDIGCGMTAALTSFVRSDVESRLGDIRAEIERLIPVGRAERRAAPDVYRDEIADIERRFSQLSILEFLPGADRSRIVRQVGTLGGGNHFIEVCVDTDDRVWVMLHSGSRNAGNIIGQVGMRLAREQAAVRGDVLPEADLAWLEEGSFEFGAYIEAMLWAQDYARLNRAVMMHYALAALGATVIGDIIDCHHNFTQLETHFGQEMWITRKGAVGVSVGEFGIIPGSMGSRSYIVRGRGCADAYDSCSHGAGRAMSRSQARRQFTIEQFMEQTSGVECRKDADLIDEIPSAYKSIDAVIASQRDLIDVVCELKQIVCIKG